MSQSRQLAAIMFTDIVGYTAMMERDEQDALRILDKHREIQRSIIDHFHGRWLKEMGDGVLASFATVTDAVYCAKEIQKTCQNESELHLRIGIHQGEVVFDGEDVFGSGVDIASRLVPLAPVGGILISESVHNNLINKKDIACSYVGEKQLKNVKKPVKVYQVHLEGVEPVATTEPSPAKQQASHKQKGLRWLINELQRREVFRTLGMYVGICWILIEMSSVLVPAFEAPEWVVRSLIIAAVIGFPIAAVLAWIYDITSDGIVVQGDTTDTEVPPLGGRKTDFIIIGVLSVALVFSIYLHIMDEPLVVEELESVSIAVLPFTNMSSDAEQEYFSDGISEELLNLLAKIPQFRVAGRTSSFAFKGKDDNLQTIGESLGVRSILEGSVRKSGERVRITAQLINVNDGFQLWSDTYDRELTDIFAVQDEIGSAVVDELKVTLLGETFGRSGPQNPINADAYNAYLQGIFYRNKQGPDNAKIAMSHFENAVVLEPDFASAWAELSVASAAYAGQASEDTEEALLRGREAAARALELDPALPEAHAALGYIQYFFDWDWDAAESSYRRALELRPGDVGARLRLARLIGDRGRFDESLNMLRSIIEADPLAENLRFSYAARLFDNEDFEACESVITHLLELNPSMSFGSLFLAWVAMYEGRLDEALTLANAEPVNLGRWIALAMVQHRLGNMEAAIEAQQELLEAYGNLGAYQQAQIHVVWGEFDEAVRWLEIAYEAHDPGLTGLKIDFILRPIHEHPGYIALLETMNL